MIPDGVNSTATQSKNVEKETFNKVTPLEYELSQVPIETSQQFLEWFTVIERELEHEQEQIYRDYMHRSTSYESVCQNLLECTQQVEDHFNAILKKYAVVNQKSMAIQSTCERVLNEQVLLFHRLACPVLFS